MSIINFPILYVPDPAKGKPLFYGQIYVGEPDLDPTVEINQKQLNIVQEDGTVVPVPQPFILSVGGVPVYNGATVRLDVEGNYSLKILDKSGAQTQYYIDNVYEGEPVTVETFPDVLDLFLPNALINDLSQAYEFATVAEYKAFTTAFPVGKVVNLLDRNAEFLVITGTGIAVDEVSSDEVNQSLKLNETDIDLRMLGAISGNDNTAILAFAFETYSEFKVKDTDCRLFECLASSNTKVTFINSDIKPILGLAGGTTGNPHRLIYGDNLENIQFIGVNSNISSSDYYPSDTTNPVNGAFERVSGINLTNPKHCTVDGFHLFEMSHGGINLTQSTPDGMHNITVKNITGDKPNYAFKAVFVGGEDEANKSQIVKLTDIDLEHGGRVPVELGEGAGFDFGNSSTDHMQVKNCNDVNLLNLTSNFACGNGVRVEKCTNVTDSGVIVHEAGQEGLQYYNTGTKNGQSSQAIVTRWGRIPNLTSVRMFGGLAYIMREYVASNTVADPSLDARFEVCPYTIANTAGIPAYDTSETGDLNPFRGYGGVAPVYRCQQISIDSPLTIPATEKTGATFDYASDFGVTLIHNSNGFTASPTIVILTNGSRILGNMLNVNAARYLDPINLTDSLASIRITGLPDEPNNLYDANDSGTGYHLTGGLSGVDRNTRMARPDIATVFDSNGDNFIELWQQDGAKRVGIKIIRADDPLKFSQINFGDESITFEINGVVKFEIDATGGHDVP